MTRHPLKHLKASAKRMAPSWLLHWYRRFRRQQKKQAYRGEKVICPICQSTFREFGVFGNPPRKNARCFQCGSLERHRLLWKYLHEKTALFNPDRSVRLLHMAPEQVYYDIFCTLPHIDYHPCDLEPDILVKRGQVPIKKADITSLPFANESMDVILCSHVLEHIPDDARAMAELLRVLKKDGWAILQVPIDYSSETTYEDFSITSPEAREKAFGQEDHVRVYGRDYPSRLRNAGFRVMEDGYVRSFTGDEQYRFGFKNDELIYYCTK